MPVPYLPHSRVESGLICFVMDSRLTPSPVLPESSRQLPPRLEPGGSTPGFTPHSTTRFIRGRSAPPFPPVAAIQTGWVPGADSLHQTTFAWPIDAPKTRG